MIGRPGVSKRVSVSAERVREHNLKAFHRLAGLADAASPFGREGTQRPRKGLTSSACKQWFSEWRVEDSNDNRFKGRTLRNYR